MTEEECGRQPYDYEKSEDLLLNFDFGEGLFVCTDFEITARIPLPALRATLPPGGEWWGAKGFRLLGSLPKNIRQKLSNASIAAQPLSWYHVNIPAEYAYSTK